MRYGKPIIIVHTALAAADVADAKMFSTRAWRREKTAQSPGPRARGETRWHLPSTHKRQINRYDQLLPAPVV